jgi:hypothetical protein
MLGMTSVEVDAVFNYCSVFGYNWLLVLQSDVSNVFQILVGM